MRDVKVDDLQKFTARAGTIDKKVSRLQVLVHNTQLMHLTERFERALEKWERTGRLHAAVFFDLVVQVMAVQHFHDHIQVRLGPEHPEIIDLDDISVANARRQARLAAKTLKKRLDIVILAAGHCRQIEHLDRNFALDFAVKRREDRGKPAGAQFALDDIARGDNTPFFDLSERLHGGFSIHIKATFRGVL